MLGTFGERLGMFLERFGSRLPQNLFLCIFVFVCLGLCDCGIVGLGCGLGNLWVCGYVFCGCMCMFACLYVFVCCVILRDGV